MVDLLGILLTGGGSGNTKTSIVFMNNSTCLPKAELFKRINFSFYTLLHNFLESIDSEVEIKNAENYRRPAHDKKLIFFLDDYSMPQINDWGG